MGLPRLVVTHRRHTITKYVDRASPRLAEAANKGIVLDTATLTMRKDGEGQKDFYLLTMTSVTVLGVQKTVSNGTPVAVEKVVLSPKVATTKYKPQDEKGGLGGEVVGTVTCP